MPPSPSATPILCPRTPLTPPAAGATLTSVVVACLGPAAAIRRCLAALIRHTDGPWELIAVTPGRREVEVAYLEGIRDAAPGRREVEVAYLEGIRDAAPRRVEVVLAPRCRTVRTAWARGLRAATGARVALLRDGVVVTDAWLRQLAALAGVGAVGPLGPATSLPEARRAGSYDSVNLDGLDEFAGRWRSERRGRWRTVDVVSGGCVLVDRELLDSASGGRPIRPGMLRPRRLAALARRVGREPALALDLFVHDDENPVCRAVVPPLAAAGSAPVEPKATASRRSRTVSLTMIVRDEEANLPACLESVRGIFDELIVVDTGSEDRTIEIARSHGAKVFEFPWVDDFAAARNAALAHATGDYAFWLDADDRIEPAERLRLLRLFDGLGPTDAAYVVRCACDPDPAGGGPTVVDHVRLFPLRNDVRWSYRVHEQILPSLRRAGVEVRWSDATVRHVGYNDPAVRRRKLDRDRAILEREAAERPDDPFVLFNLGQIAAERGEAREALDRFRRSLAGSSPADSITRKLHALIALCHQRLAEPDAATAACECGLALFPDDAELLFRRAVLHRLRNEPARAEACWRRLLTLRRPERFSSLDIGIYGHVTRRNLARLAEERGDVAEASRLWAAVLAECPGDSEATAALAATRPAAVREGAVR